MSSQANPSHPLPTQESEPLYGGRRPGRITVRDIAAAKARGEKWPMLTAYDALTAGIFDEAGIPVLLVGDSAGNVVFGYETTIPVTVDDLIPLTQPSCAVPGGRWWSRTCRWLIPGLAGRGAARRRPVHEGGGRARGQARGRPAGRPARRGAGRGGRAGDGPRGPHPAVGARVRRLPGPGPRLEAGDRLLHDAKALEAAGAFAVVLEGIPSELGARITQTLHVPTIGIGAGPECDAQVLVWQDMAGLSARSPKFAKRYADVAATLRDAATEFAADVATGAFPTEQYSYR